MIVSRIVLDPLEGFEMGYAQITAKRKRELEDIRKQLATGAYSS